MLPLDAAAAADEKVFAKQAWRIKEFDGASPAIAELRNTLQLYDGAKFLPLKWQQSRDRSKIRQRTPRAALIDAWLKLLGVKTDRNTATGGGAAAGAGGSSRSSGSASGKVGSWQGLSGIFDPPFSPQEPP